VSLVMRLNLQCKSFACPAATAAAAAAAPGWRCYAYMHAQQQQQQQQAGVAMPVCMLSSSSSSKSYGVLAAAAVPLTLTPVTLNLCIASALCWHPSCVDICGQILCARGVACVIVHECGCCRLPGTVHSCVMRPSSSWSPSVMASHNNIIDALIVHAHCSRAGSACHAVHHTALHAAFSSTAYFFTYYTLLIAVAEV
jgi:hypothetical protein